MSLERRIRNLFKPASKGETSELRKGLVSQYAHERKDAIERTIHAMTLGKDVSNLFPDILKNIATHDLDQKKLVYLYLMNYAKTHPELCILAVNTFVRDSEDPNPLVRALAIRTMGCIRVDKMLDYMDTPLRKTLEDENPYVRKTAAICVAKLFDLNPNTCIEQGFLTRLQNLLDDSNPMVVANAVSALAEIQMRSPATGCFVIDSQIFIKLLAALNECTEWGRIAILTAIADYKPEQKADSEQVCERVVPQFQHANPSVVLSAIKAVIAHLPYVSDASQESLLRKMSSPLVTLLSNPPELQFVAIRNIQIIYQKFPSILAKELRVFYCKYNDPLYLKLEKVEMMVNLVNNETWRQFLAELKEYCLEVDVEFVRRSVRALGQCAIKIDDSAEAIVETLLELLDHKISYIVQEVIIVMKDILRKYRQFKDAIPRLCDSIDEIDETGSRASIVWILGEYAEHIPPIKSLLGPFVKSFLDEGTQVQLQLLTACVKLYIKRPDDGKEYIHAVLQDATQRSDNADIRDRAYIYWRILSSDPQIAKSIILANRPIIHTMISELPVHLVNELLAELSTLASVYHESPRRFLGHGQYAATEVQKRAIEEQRQFAREDLNKDVLLDLDDDGEPTESDLNVLSDIFMNHSQNAGAPSGTTSQEILSLFATATHPVAAGVNNCIGNSLNFPNEPNTDAVSLPESSQRGAPSDKEDLIGLF